MEYLGTRGYSGTGVFQGCTALETFHYPASLQGTEFPSGNFWNEQIGIFSDCPNFKTVTFSPGTASIVDDIFHNAAGLEEIDLPGSVRSIGRGAFMGCTGLTRIYIPAAVTVIGEDAFSGHSSDLEIWCEYGSAALRHAIDNSIKYYYLSLTGASIPRGDLYIGNTFPLYGYVRSNIYLTDVHASIVDASGNVKYQVQISPDEITDYYLGGYLSSKLRIQDLPLGTYTFTLGGATEKSAETFVVTRFRVIEPPLKVYLREYSLRNNMIHEKGEDGDITASIEANYPMTRVILRVERSNGTTQDVLTVSPDTQTYRLEAGSYDLSYLPAGPNYISLVVSGHGETMVVGRVMINVRDMAALSDKNVRLDRVRDYLLGNNKEYVRNRYSPLVGFASTLTRDFNIFVDPQVGMNLFLDNWSDYRNSFIVELVSGNELGSSFYVEMCKDDIKKQIAAMNLKDLEPYEYHKSDVEKLVEAFIKGEKNVMKVYEEHKTPENARMVEEWSKMASSLGDYYKTFSTVTNIVEIFRNALNNYAKSMTVLDMLSSQNSYPGDLGRYYAMALDEVREEYLSGYYYAMSGMFDYLLEEAVDDMFKEVIKAADKKFSIHFNIATHFYSVLGKFGAYDDSSAYTDYIIGMQTYYAARDNHEADFERLSEIARLEKANPNGVYKLTQEDANLLYFSYENCRVAADRALDTLWKIIFNKYEYGKNISLDTYYSMVNAVSEDQFKFLR